MARSRSFKSELNRLIATAAVNPTFFEMLLTDPAQALDSYEKFEFTPDERKQLLTIRASTLRELAYQITMLAHETSRQHS